MGLHDHQVCEKVPLVKASRLSNQHPAIFSVSNVKTVRQDAEVDLNCIWLVKVRPVDEGGAFVGAVNLAKDPVGDGIEGSGGQFRDQRGHRGHD